MGVRISNRFSPLKLCILGISGTAGSVSMMTKRSFASSNTNLAAWGFIGLGRMGKSILPGVTWR